LPEGLECGSGSLTGLPYAIIDIFGRSLFCQA
jgi:hypothetical protein